MANPNFVPNYSTNEIYRDIDAGRCLTDDLDTIESGISTLNTAVGGKAEASHTHTEYAAAEHEHSGYATADHSHSGYASSEHTHTGFAAETHTHSDYAAATHNHDTDYIAKSLQFVADNGNIKHSFVATDDVLAKMADLECGVHTCYCPVASVNAPKQTEAWRFFVHKTGTSKNYGYCLAFGSRGSVFSNYIDQGNWRGWKTLHDIEPEPLWTGAMYMTAGHEVVPTKTLSQCRTGWLLLWSDYDAGEGENNYDFHTSVIHKRAYTGQVWGGGQHLFMVPSHYAADSNNYMMKMLHVYDAKLVGHANNTALERNDVVLRAVYEF